MEQLRAKKGFICDMDGVIYHGSRLLPGVPRFVEWLYQEGKEFLFLTNSSRYTPRELQQKLARMGLDRAEAEAISGDYYLYEHLYDLYCTEGSELAPAEHDLETFAQEQGYLTVDHIWLSTAAADPADAEAVAACRARAEEAFSKLNGSADPAHDFAVLAATYSDETDRDQHPSGYTFTVGDGTLPAACEEAAQALEEGQFSGVVEADDGFYLILRKHVDLEAVAPDYFDALLQAAADSADISTTRTYADLDVSRFYDELIAARAELDASGGEVA